MQLLSPWPTIVPNKIATLPIAQFTSTKENASTITIYHIKRWSKANLNAIPYSKLFTFKSEYLSATHYFIEILFSIINECFDIEIHTDVVEHICIYLRTNYKNTSRISYDNRLTREIPIKGNFTSRDQMFNYTDALTFTSQSYSLKEHTNKDANDYVREESEKIVVTMDLRKIFYNDLPQSAVSSPMIKHAPNHKTLSFIVEIRTAFQLLFNLTIMVKITIPRNKNAVYYYFIPYLTRFVQDDTDDYDFRFNFTEYYFRINNPTNHNASDLKVQYFIWNNEDVEFAAYNLTDD